MNRSQDDPVMEAGALAGYERRIHPRFGVPRCHVFCGGERMHLLNLGRSGMAIESFGRCNFSRSENHRFVLDDGINSIEVLGTVTWVSSSWIEEGQLPGTGLVQTVGVSFREVVSPYRVGLWRAIESWVIPPGDTARDLVPLAESPVALTRPIATMMEPRDGAIIRSRFTTVEGRLRDPNGVARLTVNGAEARIEHDRFNVRVHLAHETNYLYAVVLNWNSVGTTCFLGKVFRDLQSWRRERSSELGSDVLVLPDFHNYQDN